MIMKLYSVRDKLVGFTGPIAFKDEKVAIRWFESFCEQKRRTEFTESKYFELYEIGTFDNETAEIEKLPFTQLIKEGEQFDGKESVREQAN